jgi:hypothetical protein
MVPAVRLPIGTLRRLIPHRTINLDALISRSRPIREKMSLQVRAHFYNSLNHTNLRGPRASVSASTSGHITAAAGGRTMELALRCRPDTIGRIT